MKTLFAFFFLISFSLFHTSAFSQNTLMFYGDGNTRGLAGWNVMPYLDTAFDEPVKNGHDNESISAVANVALYYIASYDYLKTMNPDSAKPLQIYDEATNPVKVLPNFKDSLTKYGYTINNDVFFKIGLMTLGNDVNGVDWNINGTVETNVYQPDPNTGNYYILLQTDTLLKGKLPVIKQTINFNQYGDLNYYDDDIKGTSEVTYPMLMGSYKSSTVQRIAQGLMKDIGKGGLRFILDSVFYYQPGMLNSALPIERGRQGIKFKVTGFLQFDNTINCNSSNINSNFSVSKTTSTVSITNTASVGTNYKYYWTFGDGSSSNDKDPALHTFAATDRDYKVCLTVFDPLTGCKSSSCNDVILRINTCKADFTYTVDSNYNAIFTNKAMTLGTEYFWSFGDGATSSSKAPTHKYEKPGTYKVTLSTYMKKLNETCMDASTQDVTAGIPTVKADFDYFVDLTSKQIILNNKSTGGIKQYFWSLGDGKYSFETNPTLAYATEGQYEVCLFVKGNFDDQIDKKCLVINADLKTSCKADFIFCADTASENIHFGSTCLGQLTHYVWNFGDGDLSTQENPLHAYDTPGIYKVKLTVYDKLTGCIDQTEKDVIAGKIGEDCRADFFYQQDTLRNVLLINKSVGSDINQYKWDLGVNTQNRIIRTTKNTGYKYSKDGAYTVCLTVAGNNSRCRDLTCKEIRVAKDHLKAIISDFVYSIDSTNTTVTFAKKAFGKIDSYEWDFGDGSAVSIAENPTHTYANKGYYKVHLRVKNNTLNTYHDAVKLINVNAGGNGIKAAFGYNINNDFNKGVFPAEFKGANYGDGSEVEWDFGDGTQNSSTINPVHYYTAEGKYYVCYTVIDTITGDSATSCDTVAVTSTGINKNLSENTFFSINPNPAKTNVTITMNTLNANYCMYNLVDASGKIVLTKTSMQPKQQENIDVSTLEAGHYIIHIKTDKEQGIQQLLIVK